VQCNETGNLLVNKSPHSAPSLDERVKPGGKDRVKAREMLSYAKISSIVHSIVGSHQTTYTRAHLQLLRSSRNPSHYIYIYIYIYIYMCVCVCVCVCVFNNASNNADCITFHDIMINE